MDPLSVTVSIIAILQLSNKVVCYLNDVKDTLKDRANCAIETANLNSLLTSLRFRLEEGNPNTPWYKAVCALAIKNGPLDQFKQALEELQSKLTGGSKMKKVGDVLMWKFKKEEIASILGRMERLKMLVEVALQMVHFKLSQAIKEECSLIRTDISTIHSGLETIRQDQGDARHGKLLEWISRTNYPAQQSDIIGRRQEGTGQWFLDAPEFTRWLREPKEILFCPGIPGAGKTMIAAIAIDYLLKTTLSSSVGVAYVYCNYKAQDEQDTTGMLAAILKQLVQGRPSLIEPVEQLYKQHAVRGTKPLVDEVFGTLQLVLEGFSTVHVVIDALDECSSDDGTRPRFLTYIRALQTNIDVRLMATSRLIPDIISEFERTAKLKVRASDEDVRRFVAGQIYRLPNCIQRNPVLRNVVEEKIAEAADGMFLLARLHTDSLLDKRTPKDVKSTLAKLSKGSTAFDNAYKEAIQRIESQLPRDSEQAKRVLSWITYAQRPLTTAEICCALAVEQDEEELDQENISNVQDLVSICAGLVVVDEESAIIRLVHYTTQEYFERIKEQWNPTAQLDIASTCLSYLSFNTFRDGSSSSDEEFESRLEENVFLDYAAKYWAKHAANVQDEVYQLACSFLLHRGLTSCAVQVMSAPIYKWRGYSQDYPKHTTCLHILAQFRLHHLSELILDRWRRETVPLVNMRNSWNQTPFYLAAEHGQGSMPKLLLDKGADIHAQGGHDGNALQAASARGHEQVVKLLLDKGADIHAQGGYYGNALQAALAEGNEQVVKLLLDKDADIHAQGGHYGNVLQPASAGGNEKVVGLLLNRFGNDIKITEEVVKAAASNEGSGREVIEFLHRTIGFEVTDGIIEIAANSGNEDVLYLLDKWAGIGCEKEKWFNVARLYHAAKTGDATTVSQLVKEGVPPDNRNANGVTPLWLAARNGHKVDVEVLLKTNAVDVNVRSIAGRTPTFWASAFGYFEVVQLLLDHGARQHYVDKDGRSPLSVAQLYSCTKVVDILNQYSA